jgi:hypothetical protein
LWQDLAQEVHVYLQRQGKVRQVLSLSGVQDGLCFNRRNESDGKLGQGFWHRRCVNNLTQQKSDKEAELIQVMPKRKVTTKKKKPKNCFKQDASPSAHGQRWFELLQEYNLPRHYDGEVDCNQTLGST